MKLVFMYMNDILLKTNHAMHDPLALIGTLNSALINANKRLSV